MLLNLQISASLQPPGALLPGRTELNISVCPGVNRMQKFPGWWEEVQCSCSQGHPGPFHEQGCSPVAVTLSLVCLTAAFCPGKLFRRSWRGVWCCAVRWVPGQDSEPGSDPWGWWRTGRNVPHSEFSLGHLGSGHRATRGILEVGFRHPCTHVVLKTESVSRAMV